MRKIVPNPQFRSKGLSNINKLKHISLELELEIRSVPLKLNKVKGIAKDWRDCAYIYNFCVTHNCQSDTKGNDLLELIRAICLNHGITLPLHKDWRSLQRAVEARLKDLHTIYRHSWHLPAPLFATADSRQVELKPMTAVSYDIMKTICLQVLYIDRRDFAAGPPARQFPQEARQAKAVLTAAKRKETAAKKKREQRDLIDSDESDLEGGDEAFEDNIFNY